MTVTRADVARRAGVSPALVSYVLNNGPRPVSEEKRRRILAAIEELGYRPDIIARQLRTGRSHMLGLVVPDIRMPYFSEITQAISEAATRAGYQLLIASSGWDVDSEHGQIDALAQRKVDGLILMSADPTQDFQSLLPVGARVLVVDRPEASFHGAQTATTHLIEHGHTRIGYIGGPRSVVVAGRRYTGWRTAMDDAGLPVKTDYLVKTTYDRKGGHAAGEKLLGLAQPPTAIFIEVDTQAAGLLRAAFELEVQVPNDLAIATADGTELTAYSIPSLTTIVYPMRRIADDAVTAALDPEGPAFQRMSNSTYELITRESCGCQLAEEPLDSPGGRGR